MPSISPIMNPIHRISSSAGVGGALQLMESEGAECVVVEEKNRILGILDRANLSPYPPTRLLADCPIQPTKTIGLDASIEKAGKILQQTNANFLLVSNPEDEVIGTLSRTQILSSLCAELTNLSERQELATQMLQILNRAHEKTDRIRDILLLVKQVAGFHAVGIRLRKGEDFPYYVTDGFPKDFVEVAGHLCARDEEGALIRDSDGNPHLECMCGNIICGRTNPSLPFFTRGGSFWTNSTTELLSAATGEDRQALTLNRCHGEGYESVALVPLRSNHETIGLLQLNDKRKNMFTLEMIEFFEGIAASIGIALDRSQLEEQLRQAEKMEAVGQLAGGIAHDFNNQLVGVLGYADMLIDRLDDERLNRYAQNIKKCARRSADLTNQLLAFARKGDFKNIPTDIHKTIAGVVSLLQHSIDKRTRIRQHFDATPSMIIGDPTQLHSLILNIALNASDAMPKGGDLIFTTDVVTLDEAFGKKVPFDIGAGRYLKVAITDTGVGMDEETQKRMFEPFFTIKDIGKGTGMGLAGVYGAVERHKGTITVETKLGEGSTFTVYLPLAETEKENNTTAIRKSPFANGDMRVLLVDDEEIVREIVTDTLCELGYQVTTAKDGKEAVKYYQDSWEHVDLVLLDMSMPEMGGRDTFIAMRKINPEIKAILCSGYDLTPEAQEILDEGVLAFVRKPFEPAELAEKVTQVLRVTYASR